MRVSELMRLKSCEKNYRFTQLVESKSKRPLLLTKAVSAMCSSLQRKVPYKKIAEEINTILCYERGWFEDPNQASIYETDDRNTFVRFLRWFKNQAYEIVDADCSATHLLNEPFFGEDRLLTQTVHLIVKDSEGNYRAFIISPKKPSHSPKGKSVLTNTSTQLSVLVAKSNLEVRFPGITISTVHLRTELDEDGNLYPEWLISSTKKSNLLTADNKLFFVNSVFSAEKLNDKIQEIVSMSIEPPCFDCRNKNLCKAKRIKPSSKTAAENEKQKYVLPDFTEEQKEVINAVGGYVCCVAGPGSGKTATLVGRINHMVNSGIRPENILAITYTKKAAEELSERCSSALGHGESPYISTINKLCMDILHQQKDVIGCTYNVLSSAVSKQIIKNLLTAMPRISGFKYGMLKGRNGLINTAERKVTQYLSNPVTFFDKESKLGEDFKAFAQMYREAVIAGNYITYDAQITLCIDLFRSHPEILSQYQEIFRYIMVDEFQDVNEDNKTLIYLLANKYRNLCIVGDDDQAIYGFRGGDSAHMLNFTKTFPDSKMVCLSTNFRSTPEIVKLAGKLVEGNVRLDKDILSARSSGIEPCVVADNTAKTIDRLIEDALKKGYEYKDIAVLSSMNAPLETLHEELKSPTVLAKAMLINEPLFIIIKDLLLMRNGEMDDEIVAELVAILYPAEFFNIQSAPDKSLFDTIKGELPDATSYGFYEEENEKTFEFGLLKTISRGFQIIDSSSSAKALTKGISELFNLSNSPAELSILSFIEEERVSLEELTERMTLMAEMDDETRVEVETENAVLLITTHEAKGKEWPVVILQNAETYTAEPESRRAFYVAATRAKDCLYVCHDRHRAVNLSGYEIKEKLA